MYTERAKKLADLEEILDKDVYVLCHNRRNDAYIDGTMIDVLRRMMPFTKRRSGAALIIQTPGGDLNESYYIGEFFREYYDYTEAYVVSDCYSGGTIIALSTDEIYLSRSGCLGPIDIQRYNFPSEDKNWYPSLTGNVGALLKAAGNNEIDEFQKKSFSKDMDVLATYYKELFTYKELVGKNVENHCNKDRFETVWEYLAAINISHGIPLTYKKLNELGLRVHLMIFGVEKLIRSIILDIEHEFGDLKEKSVLADVFNTPVPVAANVNVTDNIRDTVGKNGINGNEVSKRRSNTKNEEHVYCFSKANENLSVIETSVMGFMQTREVGITLEDMVPKYLTVLSSGWAEEFDGSVITDKQRADLDIVVGYFAEIATLESGAEFESLTPEHRSEVLNVTYNNMAKMATDALRSNGYDADEMTSSQKYKMIVEYITESTELVSFENPFEDKLRKFVATFGKNYDELGAADRITMYSDFWSLAESLMLQVLDISDEEYSKLSVDEQEEKIMEFMLENEIEFNLENE